MDSNQKILKELSDLTRNLDVLIKEIRESNKINSENQKTTIKNLENSVQKAEDAAKKAEQTANKEQTPKSGATPTGAADSAKSAKEDLDKATKETQKRQDGMFSRFLKSLKKNSEEGNEILRKASLNSLKEANENLLKTGSIKQAISAGLTAGVKGGKEGILSLGAKKAASAISERREELKNRERVPKEEKKEDEDKKFSLKDLNLFRKKEKESKEKSTETPSKKDEKKGLFEKLSERFSKKKEESKGENKDSIKKEEPKLENKVPTSAAITTPPVKTAEILPKEEKKDAKGIFSSILEKIGVKNKESKSGEGNLTAEKGTGSTPVRTESSPKSDTLEERKTFKERAKERIEGGVIGKSVKEAKSLFSRDKKEKVEAKSEMKKEGPSLTSSSQKSSPNQTSSTQSPEKKEGSTPAATPSSSSSTPSSDSKDKNYSSTDTSGSTPDKKSSGDQSHTITPEDIKDIKSLLSSINAALKNPLVVKDNKPFRPKSNMLE